MSLLPHVSKVFERIVHKQINIYMQDKLSKHDDNNLYSIGKDRDIIKNLLRKDFRALTKWFLKNYMVLNLKKCHYINIGRNTENDKFEFDNLLKIAKTKFY